MAVSNTMHPADEKRDRARREHRHHSRPRSLSRGERGEGHDSQALEGRTDERHEPAKHLEDKR
jgi:hypothetical protein